jgi:hypothetical protein
VGVEAGVAAWASVASGQYPVGPGSQGLCFEAVAANRWAIGIEAGRFNGQDSTSESELL